jgi:hypothetical protein
MELAKNARQKIELLLKMMDMAENVSVIQFNDILNQILGNVKNAVSIKYQKMMENHAE